MMAIMQQFITIQAAGTPKPEGVTCDEKKCKIGVNYIPNDMPTNTNNNEWSKCQYPTCNNYCWSH